MLSLEFSENAQRQLVKIARRDKQTARDIKEKIQWLGANFERIEHEKMHGHPEFSLHSGQYRILYIISRKEQLIRIQDIDKHDAAYRKLRRR